MNPFTSSDRDAWPALAYADWVDTCNTLHLWTQVVGKVKLRLAPLSNHWWGIVLFVTARGLTTGAMPYGDRVLQIDFDFCAHVLVLRTSDAREQRIALEPMTTADFYAQVLAALRALDRRSALFRPRPHYRHVLENRIPGVFGRDSRDDEHDRPLH